MVSKEELESVVRKEEYDKFLKDIDRKELNKAEKDREWYLEYTKKEYHPISYQVKREVEEWERNNPFFEELEQMGRDMQYVYLFLAYTVLCISFLFLTATL